MLKRRDDAELNGELNAGEYRVARNRSGDQKVYWKCPKCFRLLTITRDNHDIRAVGTVFPSVRCPHQCGFEEWLRLDAWVPKCEGDA